MGNLTNFQRAQWSDSPLQAEHVTAQSVMFSHVLPPEGFRPAHSLSSERQHQPRGHALSGVADGLMSLATCSVA